MPDEIYSWVDPDTRELLHFDVPAMRAYAAQEAAAGVERISFPIEAEHVRLMLEYRHVDVSHARRSTIGKLREPLLGVLRPDGSTLTVDGHHRFVRLHELEIPEALMDRFEWLAVQRFLLEAPVWLNEQIRREIEGA